MAREVGLAEGGLPAPDGEGGFYSMDSMLAFCRRKVEKKRERQKNGVDNPRIAQEVRDQWDRAPEMYASLVDALSRLASYESRVTNDDGAGEVD